MQQNTMDVASLKHESTSRRSSIGTEIAIKLTKPSNMDNMPLTSFKEQQNKNMDYQVNPLEDLEPKIEDKRTSNQFEKKGFSTSTDKITRGHKRPKSSA